MNSNLAGKDILVIDDDQTMLEIINSVLRKEDAHTEWTNSGVKGYDMALERKFDAIVLDRYMPGEDGHDILVKLKENATTKNIPVIMLTGEKNMTEIKKSLDLGAQGYIVKPFKPADFMKQLSRLIQPQSSKKTMI